MMVVVCADCGRDVDRLDVFPKQRCLQCHDAAPEVQRAFSTLTGESLARIWGAK